MCSRVSLLFGKLPQWYLHVNCHVNGTTFQNGLRCQTGLSSLRVSCKRALRKVVNRNFRGTFWKTVSGKLIIQIPQADWPEVVVIWAPFKRQKIEFHIFERANLSGFGIWKFTAKEDLNQQKQVFFLNFRPWSAQKPKIWSIFYGKKFI